jgi:hypothetical protein
MVDKRIVSNTAMKIVYKDRIIALKLKTKPVSVLQMQMYTPKSDYECDEV